jgi:polysaccharide chain length determinant protein (PEP-CTERM system associated)
MNPLFDHIWDETRSCWRFRWIALAAATAVAIVGWMIVFALPDRYEAAASVFVDTHTQQDVDADLNFVRQSLLAGPKLQRIAREAGALPSYPLEPRTQEGTLAGMRARIEIDAKSASGREEERKNAGTIYRIVFRDPNQTRALNLVTALLRTFVDETLRRKHDGAEKAEQLLKAQLADVEKRLSTAEDQLEAFKSKSRDEGLMPTEPGGYSAQLRQEQDKVSDLNTKLREAEARRETLTKQLNDSAAGATTPAPGGTGGAAATDLKSQVDAARAELDNLLLRFTDNHPDVIAARKRLEDLEQRLAAQGLKKGAGSPPGRTSSDPVYQDVRRELNHVEVDITGLKTGLAEHESKVAELQRLAGTAPQLESELAKLNDEHNAVKAEYDRLYAALQKALAPTVESNLFDIVEPPTVSLRPVWPKRPLLLAESFLAALAAGIAAAYGLHYLRPVFTTTSALAQAAGVPVLGVVSVAFPERARRATRGDVVRFSLAGACLGVAFIAVLVLSLDGYHLSVTALKQMLHS